MEMRLSPDCAKGISSTISAVILVVILLLAASAVYLSLSQGGGGISTGSSTSVPTSSSTLSTTSSTSSISSLTSSSTTSSHPSSSSATSSTTAVSTSSSANKSEVEVIIPPGIENVANKVSFEPINVTLVIGVNNTIVFVNHDDQEHILESTLWPTNGQPFQLYSIPGTSVSVTLSTPGKYTYFCEWHPIWMDGEINVIA